ncbi:hypothetical protein GCM10009850_119010 [Nonomuraea monospora]|uniref:Uncharacterized protein n=1 Tax=Nonomuraea monospora TaxID=568818 RepID=A0ABP5Q167_9ACTN
MRSQVERVMDGGQEAFLPSGQGGAEVGAVTQVLAERDGQALGLVDAVASAATA